MIPLRLQGISVGIYEPLSEHITNGVPQDFVLELLRFLLFITDLAHETRQFMLCHFKWLQESRRRYIQASGRLAGIYKEILRKRFLIAEKGRVSNGPMRCASEANILAVIVKHDFQPSELCHVTAKKRGIVPTLLHTTLSCNQRGVLLLFYKVTLGPLQ